MVSGKISDTEHTQHTEPVSEDTLRTEPVSEDTLRSAVGVIDTDFTRDLEIYEQRNPDTGEIYIDEYIFEKYLNFTRDLEIYEQRNPDELEDKFEKLVWFARSDPDTTDPIVRSRRNEFKEQYPDETGRLEGEGGDEYLFEKYLEEDTEPEPKPKPKPPKPPTELIITKNTTNTSGVWATSNLTDKWGEEARSSSNIRGVLIPLLVWLGCLLIKFQK